VVDVAQVPEQLQGNSALPQDTLEGTLRVLTQDVSETGALLARGEWEVGVRRLLDAGAGLVVDLAPRLLSALFVAAIFYAGYRVVFGLSRQVLQRSSSVDLGLERDAKGERNPAVVAWAAQIAELVRAQGSTRLAIDRMIGHFVALALADQGIALVAGGPAMGQAQAIKSLDEVQCITLAIAATETGMAKMREAVEPGVTENELWGILNGTNIALGGEYSDTRLLSSGGRTNPWYQEATDRRVRPGELVTFDTDMIGPFGYDADISRAFFCGPGRPSAEQRRLYGTAFEQLQHNLALIKPGAAFKEMSEKGFKLPEEFYAQQMPMTWHGVGLYGQWPTIVGPGWYKPDSGLDGEVQPGMVLCCESYVGAVGGLEGVKLEQQVLVTDSGYELLTTFPFEEALLGKWI
jgi:Xaa-Pro aminopeptidase